MSSRSRLTLVTSLVAGLVALGAAPPAADAARARGTAQARKARTTPKKATKRTKAKARRGKATRRANNMPEGWTWPPSKAMAAQGASCTDELDALGIGWKPAKRQKKVATPITLDTMELGGVKLTSWFRSGPHVMDCNLALGLARQLPALYDAGVRELIFSRIYGYTHVRTGGRELKALSRHALGLAIDVRAFVDDTGRKAVVLEDYPRSDELLLQIEQTLTDSGAFRTILTPRNDPESHDDHFHLEVRVDYSQPLPKRPAS